MIGLPPDLPIEIDDTMIRQFRSSIRRFCAAEDKIADFIAKLGKTKADPPQELLERSFDEFAQMRPLVEERFAEVQDDLQEHGRPRPTRFKLISRQGAAKFETDRRSCPATCCALKDGSRPATRTCRSCAATCYRRSTAVPRPTSWWPRPAHSTRWRKSCRWCKPEPASKR